jgi:hypothetical protein
MGGRPWLPTMSRSRPSESRGAAVELGFGVGETVKAQEEWFAGVLVVLMRIGVKAVGFCTELSTVATMWRPVVAWEVVARAEEGSRGELVRRAMVRRHVGEVVAGGGAVVACTVVTARGSAPAAESSRGAEGARGRRKEGGVRRTYVQN